MTYAADVLEALLEPDHSDYDQLPESIKALYTREEHLWLSDEGKARLLQVETEPDWTEP